MDYSYKVDRYTGEILDDPQDKDNNSIDAIRYALQDVILESHAIISPRGLILHKEKDLLDEIHREHRHLNFYRTFISNEKAVFQHLIAVHKVTKMIYVLKELYVIDTKKADASVYFSEMMGHEFTLGKEVVGLTLDNLRQESDNIYHMRRFKFVLVNDDQPTRDEKIRLATSTSLLRVSSSCIVTRRHFFSYREHKGKIQDKLNESVKAIGLVLQFTNHDTKGLTPIVVLDENDKRFNELIIEEYEEDQEMTGYQDDDAFEIEGSF